MGPQIGSSFVLHAIINKLDNSINIVISYYIVDTTQAVLFFRFLDFCLMLAPIVVYHRSVGELGLVFSFKIRVP